MQDLQSCTILLGICNPGQNLAQYLPQYQRNSMLPDITAIYLLISKLPAKNAGLRVRKKCAMNAALSPEEFRETFAQQFLPFTA